MTNPTIEALRKRSRKIIKIPDPDDESVIYEFQIRALSTFELAEHSQIFEDIPEEGVLIKESEDKMNKKNLKMLKDVILPMMKVFLPMCTVSPKITFDIDKEGDEVVHISDIPMVVSSMVFKEILDLSGISKAAEDARKKKSAQITPSTKA